MWTLRPLAPYIAWRQRDMLDGNGRRALDEDTAPLVARERAGPNEVRRRKEIKVASFRLMIAMLRAKWNYVIKPHQKHKSLS